MINKGCYMKKILLIDDDRVNSTMIKFGLKGEEFEVEVAHDGAEGVDMIKNKVPDLIVLDVQMPKMGGFEFLNEMKSLGLNVPILMLTANENLEDVFRMEGVKGYLVKPITPVVLKEKIKACLE